APCCRAVDFPITAWPVESRARRAVLRAADPRVAIARVALVRRARRGATREATRAREPGAKAEWTSSPPQPPVVRSVFLNSRTGWVRWHFGRANRQRRCHP